MIWLSLISTALGAQMLLIFTEDDDDGVIGVGDDGVLRMARSVR